MSVPRVSRPEVPEPSREGLAGALRESEDVFQLLVESVKEYAIFVLDPEGRVASWNPGAEALKGYKAEEIIGQSFERFYRPEDVLRGRPRQGLEAARRSGRYVAQGERLRKDGSIFWAEVLITPLYRPNGELRGYAKVTRDATERRRAEQRLAESEARFRALADHISQLAWMAGADASIFWYNRRWFEYTGTTFEQMQGWGWKSVHHPDHVERVVRRWERSRDTGEPWEDTFPLRGRDGRYRWFLSRALPIRDAQGRVTLWFGTNTDITEQLEATEALREAERRLRFTLDSSRIGDWDLDLETGRVTGSREHFHALGHREPLPGWSLERFLEQVHPEDRARVERLLAEAVDNRQELHYDCRVLWPDGSVHWIEVHGALRPGAGGAPHMSGIVYDVTPRRRSEEAVRQLAATLEQRVLDRTAQLANANLELQAFSYTVSHDLRAPLRGIQGFASVLLEDFGKSLGEEGREYCERIGAAGQRMERLIEDLLAYSRMAREEVSVKPVELDAVVNEVRELLAEPLRASGARLHVDSPLPAVLGYRPLLIQALQNLLGNAIKFVAPGTVPEVRVRGEIREGRARLYVEDNGIGIAPQHAERIFNVFERLHGQEAYPGTGIGLAIVRRVAERLGGRAGFEPRPQGSCFWMELPAGREGAGG